MEAGAGTCASGRRSLSSAYRHGPHGGERGVRTGCDSTAMRRAAEKNRKPGLSLLCLAACRTAACRSVIGSYCDSHGKPG